MGFGWIWIALAIVLIVVVWLAAARWNHRRQAPLAQPRSMNNAQPANNEQPAPATSAAVLSGSGVQILASTNKRALVGQPFEICNATVQEKSGDRAFWISAPGSAPMLVVLSGNNPGNANIGPGVRVNINGTVARTPSAA